MKKSILWMMAAILTCGLTTVFTSCGSDKNDPPCSGSYVVEAKVTAQTCSDRDNPQSPTYQFFMKYMNKVQQANTEFGQVWNVSVPESQLGTALAANNERAVIALGRLVTKLEEIKAEFEADNGKAGVTGIIHIEVNASAYKTLGSAGNVAPDKKVTMSYGN